MIADSPRIHWMRAQQCRFWETAIEYPTDEIYGHASLPVAKWPTATPTRHVTRDLRMKQTIKKPKLRKPLTKRQVRTATGAQLRDEMDYWGHIPGSQIKTRAQDDAYYTAKNELTLRANPNLALYMHRQGARAIGGKTVRKRQARTVRATAPRTRPRKRRSHRSRYE